MPARKNRPDKHGHSPRLSNPEHTAENYPPTPDELVLIKKLVFWERRNPGSAHYVGWPDMACADHLAKKGLIADDQGARGCFRVLHQFTMRFMRLQVDDPYLLVREAK